MIPKFPTTEVHLPTWLKSTTQPQPGDPATIDFLTKLSQRLLAKREHPELVTLGFFLRRTELNKANLTDRRPQGLVLHIPPTNVDTLFAYTWALSALAGNRNIVRISPRSGPAADAILAALNDIDADPIVTASQLMITYGRNDALTAMLSASCDLRVIWGGDETVTKLRRFPLAPHARDLTFPDRSSFAAVSVRGWQSATPVERTAAVRGFHNDTYWFDQAACASPRTIFWIGEEDKAAHTEFATRLADIAEPIEPAMAIRKRTATYGLAADGTAKSITFHNNAVATLDITEPVRTWLAQGTFPQLTLPTLTDLVPLIERKDQTLTCYGFDRAELAELATALNGKGIDRIVPFGSALAFGQVWDGYHLLTEFTRIRTIC